MTLSLNDNMHEGTQRKWQYVLQHSAYTISIHYNTQHKLPSLGKFLKYQIFNVMLSV
jgi:hypothetical protein